MSGPSPDRPWFREWFGEAYLEVYPHRDRAEAERAVELFRREASPGAGARVLDLACGAGRHLGPLAAAGFRPVGLDLSAPLLRRAARTHQGRLVRGDMRALPLADASVDAAVQFFTSFGYFERRSEDRRVLDEVRRVLRAGGAFLLDFLNARRVREELVPRDERVVDGRRIRQRRWLEEGTVVKRIEIEPDDGGKPDVYHERVRLYEPGELEAMLEEAGLRVRDRFGDYDGSPFREEARRLVLVGAAT